MLEARLDRLGEFLERTKGEPERWDGMPGYVAVDTAGFTDLGDGATLVSTTSLFHTVEERDGMLNSGMAGGLNESYARCSPSRPEWPPEARPNSQRLRRIVVTSDEPVAVPSS